MAVLLSLFTSILSTLPIYIFKGDSKKFALIDVDGNFFMANLKENKDKKKQFKFTEGGDSLINFNKQRICYDTRKNILVYCPKKGIKNSSVLRKSISLMPSVDGMRISFGDRFLKAIEVVERDKIPLKGRVFSITGIRKSEVEDDDKSIIFNKEEAILPGDRDDKSSSSDSEADSTVETKVKDRAKEFYSNLDKKNRDMTNRRERRKRFYSEFNKSHTFNENLTHRTLPMRIKAANN